MKEMRFAKIEAVGNSFVLIDALSLPEMDWSFLAKRMCVSHYGIGSDGLLVLLPSGPADFRMRMFNPDGTEDVCGNGLRCVAVYVQTNRLISGREMTIEMCEHVYCAEIIEPGTKSALVRTSMGRPSLWTTDLPSNLDVAMIIDYPFLVGGETCRMTCVSVGTPHAIIFAPLELFWDAMPAVSSIIETHPAFPERISVDWCVAESSDSIRIRTWERAVGPTLGCGTGACAALVASNLMGLVGTEASITSPGGTLDAQWRDRGELFISGPTNIVFEGKWNGRSTFV